ncbi:extracellular solute-binding protein [Ruminococcaceae bacterium OttesenSCG-928-I18]|nr:extracellular solute-binding protein [Ruminococcaceae bacterium OttesenSCG-928-I18]
MKKFRKWICVLLSALMVLGLASCSGGGTSEAAPPEGAASGAASGEATTGGPSINVILPGNIEGQLIKDSIPDFESETGITVNVTEVPVDTLNTKITVELESGGSTADVVAYPYEWIPKFADSLLALDGYISEEDKNDIAQYAWDSASYNGSILGQMYVVTGMIMFYRSDLLEDAGLEVPTTWDEYVSVSQALTTDDMYGTVVTAKLAEEPVGMYLNYLYQNGGDILDEEGNVILNNEAGVEAMQFMVDLVYEYQVAPEAASTFTTTESLNLFTEEQVALCPNWSYVWSVSQADDSPIKDKVGMALLPENKEAGISLGGWVMSAVGASQNPDAAYQFIQFMNDTERQVRMAVEGGNTPTRTSALEAAEVKEIPLFDVMSEALATSVPRSKYPKYDEISNEIAIALSGSLAQTGEPQELLDTAAANIEAILAS